MKTVIVIICAFALFLFFSCPVHSWDINRYKSQFEENRQSFERLIALLKAQNVPTGYFINSIELNEETQTLEEELDLSSISTGVTSCKDTTNYEFETHWTNKAHVHFSKDDCDKEQTQKGYHGKASEMIEVWGLGDGWTMWIDYDFI